MSPAPDNRFRVGELRPSQLLHTFGIGSIADLPNLSVMVMGLDRWDPGSASVIAEQRLLAAVRRKLGPQVAQLRLPPHQPKTRDPFGSWASVGVPVEVFPGWLRCSNPSCNLLAPARSGLFTLKANSYAPEKTRYVHNHRVPATALPARFVLACPNGHLDDFPWLFFVHGGTDPGPGHTLTLVERGTTGEAANIFVRCSCNESRSMADAIGHTNQANLPACRGRHPHLDKFDSCGEQTRTLALGATNSWFAMQLKVFSLPRTDEPVEQAVREHWESLSILAPLPAETVKALLPTQSAWQVLEQFGVESVYQTIAALHASAVAPGADEESETQEQAVDLRAPEWDAFTDQREHNLDDFSTRRERGRIVPAGDTGAASALADIVRVTKLREVSALYAFTRLDAPDWDTSAGAVGADNRRCAPISSNPPSWVPCAETRGEGIFLRFDEARIARWEQLAAVREREAVLRTAHARWCQRMGAQLDWPGVRYVLLHTLAHCLIREFALECGYGASGISERIYARSGDQPMAGFLLYTAAPDSEGTLGGLVSLGEKDRLVPLLGQAMEAAQLCGSDPLCAEHDPREHGRLHGAACHACLFAAETSCETGNRYLDRALLVDTFAQSGIGFFDLLPAMA
ncbi:DUF1998 domain-containing protein [Actinospica sp. MGRD01-02]|uniref:DUF1998 domain-containing protein n=1 Tax=Actinospica acidithermotolerans TaxID=2828514 RepID=A0A941E6I0_9ACTN|nr:DUF1998 domain-containing protein [Actinospica acidithermotolerans]MBR7824677.1 DUF1998 domain-containing protein [Actinospica acidithermotolerans]